MSAVAQYRVRAGDGLERIAKRLGTTEAALRAANPEKLGRRSAMIHPGDVLVVPQRGGRPTQQTRQVAQLTPSTQRGVSLLRTPLPAGGLAPARPGTAAAIASTPRNVRQQHEAAAASFSTRNTEQVTSLQRLLNAGRPAGTAALDEDGDWGPKTREALAAANMRNCIAVPRDKLLIGASLTAMRGEAIAAGNRNPPEVTVPRQPQARVTPEGHGTPVDPAIREVGAYLRGRVQGTGLPRGFELKIAQSLQGQVHVETTNGEDVRTSSAGARGIVQIIPSTAADIVMNDPENLAFLRRTGLIPASVQGAAVRPYIQAHYADDRFNAHLAGMVMFENSLLARQQLGSRASADAIITRARRLYHGGPDRSNWGPVNAAYDGKVQRAINGMLRRGELLTRV